MDGASRRIDDIESLAASLNEATVDEEMVGHEAG
jgi:hypothetical protein